MGQHNQEEHTQCDLMTWKCIEIDFHGPYDIPHYRHLDVDKDTDARSCIIITIFDPFSKWITAKSIVLNISSKCGNENQVDINLIAQSASNYIFTNLCHFGLARFSLNYNNMGSNCASEFPNFLNKHLAYQLDKLDVMTFNIIKDNHQCDKKTFRIASNSCEEQTNLFQRLNHSYKGDDSQSRRQVTERIKSIVEEYKASLKEEADGCVDLNTFLDILFMKERIGFSSCNLGKESDDQLEHTPFSYMFARRDPFLAFSEVCTQKGLRSGPVQMALSSSPHQYHRRNLKSALLECRHCGDIFTSRISFKIHQKCHLDEAKRRGALEGEKPVHLENIKNNDEEDTTLIFENDDTESDEPQDRKMSSDTDYKINKRASEAIKRRRNNTKVNQAMTTFPRDRAKKITKSACEVVNTNINQDIKDMRENTDEFTLISSEFHKYERGKGKTEEYYTGDEPQSKDTDFNSQKSLCDDINETVKETTVQNVKALLVATKEERRKRGRYIKYDQELRNEIAKFAENQGASKTAKMYTEKLNSYISESTVRNFMKAYSKEDKYWAEFKKEIGEYAHQFGVENCIQKYKNRLECGDKPNENIAPRRELTRGTVIRFKAAFLTTLLKNNAHGHIDDTDLLERSKTLCTSEEKEDTLYLEMDNDSDYEFKNLDSVAQRFVFDDHLKLDIGRYAFHCGNLAAINHFSSKLQFNMKESTVRKFKRIWMKNKKITNLTLRNTRSSSTRDVDVSDSSKYISPFHLSIINASSSSISDINIDINKPIFSHVKRGNVQHERNKIQRISQNHQTAFSSHSRMPVKQQSSMSSHGRGEDGVLLGSSSSLSSSIRTKIPLSSCDDMEDNNIPVSLIINNKGRLNLLVKSGAGGVCKNYAFIT